MTKTKAPPTVDEHVTALAAGTTPSGAEVADWHYIDITLKIDRGRPLVRLLFNLAFAPPEPVVDLRERKRDLAIA